MSRNLRSIVTTLVIVAIFAFLLRNLILNWTRIPFDKLQLNIPLIILSFCMLIAHFISYSKSWQVVMQALGVRIGFSQSIWMIATTQIGKYVPGKIWYMVGRVYVGKKASIDGKILAISMVLETCLLIVTGSIIFLVATIIAGDYRISTLIPSIALMLVAVAILHPKPLVYISNAFLRILKKPTVAITLPYSQIFYMSIYFFILWIAQIIGFYFLVCAFYPIALFNIFTLAAAYTLSWITGFIALFAPGGLGVREGMMTLLLSPILPTPLAIAISFLSRVWITVFEAIVFLVGLIIQRKTSTRSAP